MSKSFAESGGHGTVFKPLSAIEAIIMGTSPGDMLLFMIAQQRKESKDRANALAVPQNNFVEIGKND